MTGARTGTYGHGMRKAWPHAAIAGRDHRPAARGRAGRVGTVRRSVVVAAAWPRRLSTGHTRHRRTRGGAVPAVPVAPATAGYRARGLAAAALAVKYGAHLNLWSASAAVLAAAYGLGGYGRQPARRAARLLAGVSVLAAVISLQAFRGSHSAAIACALFGTALVLGEVTASHRDVATSAARHAHEQERAVLAREIHDVVAHQLSAIAVQAGAARFASADDPHVAVAAVAAIEQGARDGLAELNTLVRRLRQSGAADQHAAAQPRLEDVGGLIERARAVRPARRAAGRRRGQAADRMRSSWPATGSCRRA